MELTLEIKEKIKAFSLQEPENEICGLLLKEKDNNIKVIKCENYSQNKKHSFSISPFDYIKISVSGEIIGYFHSHNDKFEDFSLIDKIQAESHNLTSILYCTFNDTFKQYIPIHYKNPYIGRNFEIGKNDCFSLFRDYYKNELKIEIQNCERNEKWFEKNENLFEEIYNKENFIKFFDIKELKINDGIIFKMLKNKASHIAIYLGNMNILHHPRNALSLIEILTEPYIRKIDYFIRHKNLCNI